MLQHERPPSDFIPGVLTGIALTLFIVGLTFPFPA